MKKNILTTVVSVLVVLGIGYFVMTEQNKDLPNCIKLVSESASLTMHYPDSENFVDISYENGIRIAPYGEWKAFIIAIDADYVSIENILDVSATGNGPKYVQGNFNGWAAAIANVDDPAVGAWQDYNVPIADRGFSILFNSSSLSPENQRLAKEMLDSITFKEKKHDSKEVIVQKCSWFE